METNLHSKITETIRTNILNDQYPSLKLPDERSLSDTFGVSRSTIKRAVDTLVSEGLVFKKQGSGTFINQIFKKNYRDYYHQKIGPIGLTKSFEAEAQVIESKILVYEVIRPDETIQRNLLIHSDEFVYYIKRVRYIDHEAVSIETDYIPVKLAPAMTEKIALSSLYEYANQELHLTMTKSYISIASEPSNKEDQAELCLQENEPVTVTEEIVFLDTGHPFEYTIVRNHYKKFTYNSIQEIGSVT